MKKIPSLYKGLILFGALFYAISSFSSTPEEMRANALMSHGVTKKNAQFAGCHPGFIPSVRSFLQQDADINLVLQLKRKFSNATVEQIINTVNAKKELEAGIHVIPVLDILLPILDVDGNIVAIPSNEEDFLNFSSSVGIKVLAVGYDKIKKIEPPALADYY